MPTVKSGVGVVVRGGAFTADLVVFVKAVVALGRGVDLGFGQEVGDPFSLLMGFVVGKRILRMVDDWVVTHPGRGEMQVLRRQLRSVEIDEQKQKQICFRHGFQALGGREVIRHGKLCFVDQGNNKISFFYDLSNFRGEFFIELPVPVGIARRGGSIC